MSRIQAATDEGGRDFMAQGSCLSTGNPDQWYPDHSGRGSDARAKRICDRCYVQAQCLTYALDHDEDHGIWGGTTPQERADLLALARAVDTPTHAASPHGRTAARQHGTEHARPAATQPAA